MEFRNLEEIARILALSIVGVTQMPVFCPLRWALTFWLIGQALLVSDVQTRSRAWVSFAHKLYL